MVNFPCILKNDVDNSNSNRPVSIIIRTANASNNYVHVLRCSNCDFITLLPSNLKEHIRASHPSIESVAFFVCSLCNSTSTERSLLEEHMKVYHTSVDTSNVKILETRYPITGSDPAPTTALPVSTMTTPITITSPSPAVGGNRVGQVSSPHSQMQQASTTSVTSSTDQQESTHSPPQSSSPPTITSSLSSSQPSSQPNKSDPAPASPKKPVPLSGSRRRKATTPGKLLASGCVLKRTTETLDELSSKRPKSEEKEEVASETGSLPTSSQTVVCGVNGLSMGALRSPPPSQTPAQTPATPTSPAKIATAIMMDANSAKSLLNQILAAAAAGQSRIEVSGTANTSTAPNTTAAAAASSTTTANANVITPTGAEQALDMSMRPTMEAQAQLTVKAAEFKLSDLIQADQLQVSTANSLEALRSALTAQFSGAAVLPTSGVLNPSANATAAAISTFPGTPGVHQITIGLPPNFAQSFVNSSSADAPPADASKQTPASQIVGLAQLHALLNAITGVKAQQAPKEESLQPSGLDSNAMVFTNAGLALAAASALTAPQTDSSGGLKGITLSNGDFTPVTSLMASQPAGLGSYALTTDAAASNASSLANFVTSLNVVPSSTATGGNGELISVLPSLTQTSGAVTSSTSSLPFDPTFFTPTGIMSKPQMRLQTNETSIPKSDSAPDLKIKPEATSNGPDGDTDYNDDTLKEEGLLSNTREDCDSPLSGSVGGGGGGNASRKTEKSSRRSASGAGSKRPHRQNFTMLQNRILTEWYNQHHMKPYPSTEDTKMLAQKADLTYSQVKKWFANKRARTSNGVPKQASSTSEGSTVNVSTEPSAYMAAMAAALSTNSTSTKLLSLNGTTSNSSGVFPSPIVTSASASSGSILVPSGLMIRANGPNLGTSGLTILAPRPPAHSVASTAQPTPIISVKPTSSSEEEDSKPLTAVKKEDERGEKKTDELKVDDQESTSAVAGTEATSSASAVPDAEASSS